MLNNNNNTRKAIEGAALICVLSMAADQKAVEILEQAIAGRTAEMAAKYPGKVVGLYRDPFAPKEIL